MSGGLKVDISSAEMRTRLLTGALLVITVFCGCETSSAPYMWPAGTPINEREVFCHSGTVGTVFSAIEEAIDQRYDVIEVSYHPTLGYPMEMRCNTPW